MKSKKNHMWSAIFFLNIIELLLPPWFFSHWGFLHKLFCLSLITFLVFFIGIRDFTNQLQGNPVTYSWAPCISKSYSKSILGGTLQILDFALSLMVLIQSPPWGRHFKSAWLLSNPTDSYSKSLLIGMLYMTVLNPKGFLFKVLVERGTL